MLRYALTIFLSAFLLFQVQPVIGKYILPWFGGGPSIWTTCMLFFQMLLLGGYMYAHVLSEKFNARTQSIIHLALLAVTLLLLPIEPSAAWKPDGEGNPAGRILVLLLVAVGGPYFMLASTGPLMQRWFARSCPGRSPYRLYALSNVGSLLALLGYPFLVEPALRLQQQTSFWSWGYVAYVALAAWCAAKMFNLEETLEAAPSGNSTEEKASTASAQKPSIGQMLLWLGLSACGSAIMLSTTNQMCIDVASFPFLWILPLTLYLVTFIICFDSPRWYDRRIFGPLLAVAAPVACWLLSDPFELEIPLQIALYSTVMFACCMTCHGELTRSKPDPKYLTLFFLLISAGGAVGGLFVAIVAPSLFDGFWEYHVSLFGVCLLTPMAWYVNQAYKERYSLSFLVWPIAVALKCWLFYSVFYLQHADIFDAFEKMVLFSVFAVLQMVGLIWTLLWEGRPKLSIILWIGVIISEAVWCGAYASTLADADNTLVAEWLAGFTILSLVVCAVAWGLSIQLWNKLKDRPQSLPLWVWLAISGLNGWLLYAFVYKEHFQLFKGANQALLFCIFLGIQFAGIALMVLLEHDDGSKKKPSRKATLALAIGWGLTQILWGIGFAMYACQAAGDAFSDLSTSHLAIFAGCSFVAMGVGWSLTGVLLRKMDSRYHAPASDLVVRFIPLACLLTLAGLGTQLVKLAREDAKDAKHLSRNFYGVLRVSEHSDDVGQHYSLVHGQIEHGFQYHDEAWKNQPTSYYGPDTGVGLALRLHPRRLNTDQAMQDLRIGVVGLGTGTITTYGRKGDYVRIYEINPAVLALSEEEENAKGGAEDEETGEGKDEEAEETGPIFTYLNDSPAKIEVVLGDARIMMEHEQAREEKQKLDVLAIDAFSSDAIPVHLLTSECAELYRYHLKEDGILALHISNRYLDLEPISRALAKHLGWTPLRIDTDEEKKIGLYSTTWIVLTKNKQFLEHADVKAAHSPWDADDPKPLLWTDDFAGLWQILSY